MKRLILVSLFFAVAFLSTSCEKEGFGIGEEGGSQLALDQTFDNVRKGIRLVMSYDATTDTFSGTLENTANKTKKAVRVEIHLSNGVELGPTTPGDMAPGETRDVTLDALGESFTGWIPHAEVG